MNNGTWTLLRRDGVALILAAPETGLPAVLHWGADLGPLDAADLDGLDRATARQTAPGTLDAAWRLSLAPQESEGWPGRPALLATRDGPTALPALGGDRGADRATRPSRSRPSTPRRA